MDGFFMDGNDGPSREYEMRSWLYNTVLIKNQLIIKNNWKSKYAKSI